jgi:hypothetical protein
MIKLRNFWSKNGADTIAVSLLLVGMLALYLFAAYFIMTF